MTAANLPAAVLDHAKDAAESRGQTVHVVWLPDSHALLPYGMVTQSEMRFEREKYRPNEVCAVTTYGRVIDA